MLRLDNARLVDPVHGLDRVPRSLHVQDGRIVADPGPHAVVDRSIDLEGALVMAGALDIHTHIGGGKINVARGLLDEDHLLDARAGASLPDGSWMHAGCGRATPTTWATGYRYAEMGYTACFEPAMLPLGARQAHMELADTPMVDKGAYVMLGNDDYLLRMLSQAAAPQRIADYVGWMVRNTQALAVKVVNPGGISAFKFNQRALDFDALHPHYRVSPRQVLQALARAVHELGLPHPLHVHASNLGVAGNVASTLATMEAAEGLPLHITHIQFHSYGTEGERKFSSAAEAIADAVNRLPNISIDVGQILFGQTITASGDTMAQFANHRHAHPKAWNCTDIECDAGCGVVPFRYRDKQFVNALQWTIGLELFLRVADPWRVFLTTDHSNGAPFTSYPHLIRLLMDRDFRNRQLDTLHAEVGAHSQLRHLQREYSLSEIAVITRAAPARALGLHDRGHLGPGAVADIVAYREHDDVEAMFARPTHVFKDGELIVRDGRVVRSVQGRVHTAAPEFDPTIESELDDYFGRYMTLGLDSFKLGTDELCACGAPAPLQHACRRKSP